MFIDLVDNPVEFRSRVAAFFSSEPISTNVIATVNEQVISENPLPDPGTTWIIVTGSDGGVLGAAMANGPWNLFVSGMPPDAPEAIADRLFHRGCRLPGVSGEARAVTAFAERWRMRTRCPVEREGTRRVHVLGDLVAPAYVAGTARRFTITDVPLAADWLGRFHDEAMPEDPVLDWAEEAERRIDTGDIWAWDSHGEPVAMAAVSRPAAGVARIGPVFTPPTHRGHGYAAGATTAATRDALGHGAAHVMLYTDAANAASNALYQRLGYRFDHEAAQYRFGPSAP